MFVPVCRRVPDVRQRMRAAAQLLCLDRKGKELVVAGKKREKSLPQTDKKTAAKPKRPKKTSRGK